MIFNKKSKTLEAQLKAEISVNVKQENRLFKQVGIDAYFSGLMEDVSSYGEIGKEERETLQNVYEAALDTLKIRDSGASLGKRVLATVLLGTVQAVLTQTGARYRISNDSTNPLAPKAQLSIDILLGQYGEVFRMCQEIESE